MLSFTSIKICLYGMPFYMYLLIVIFKLYVIYTELPAVVFFFLIQKYAKFLTT